MIEKLKYSFAYYLIFINIHVYHYHDVKCKNNAIILCATNYILLEIGIVGTGRYRAHGTIVFGKGFIKYCKYTIDESW